MSEIIEINGINYIQRKRESKKQKPMNSKLFSLLTIGSMISGGIDLNKGYSKTTKTEKTKINDWLEEYKLIQQKKSHLSRSERNSIIRWFEENYSKIKNNENETKNSINSQNQSLEI